MAQFITLSNLRSEIRDFTELNLDEQKDYVTDSELDNYIQLAYNDLYNRVVETQQASYFQVSSSLVATTASVDTYDLPSDLLQLHGIDLLGGSLTVETDFTQSNETRYPNEDEARIVPMYHNWERHWGRGWDFGEPYTHAKLSNYKYHLLGSLSDTNFKRQVRFTPVPDGGTDARFIRFWYVPECPELSDRLYTFNHWKRYLIIRVAVDIMLKQQKPVEELVRERRILESKIEDAAKHLDTGGQQEIFDYESFAESGGFYHWD